MSQGLRKTSIGLAVLGLVVFLISLGYFLVGTIDGHHATWECTSTQNEANGVSQFCRDSDKRMLAADGERLSLLGIGLELAAVALAFAAQRGGSPTAGPSPSGPGYAGAVPPAGPGAPAGFGPGEPGAGHVSGPPAQQYPGSPPAWQQHGR